MSIWQILRGPANISRDVVELVLYNDAALIIVLNRIKHTLVATSIYNSVSLVILTV